MEVYEEQGISFKEFVDRLYNAFRYLLSKKIYIALSGCVLGVWMAVIASSSSVLYEATNFFSLDEEKQNTSNLAGYASIAQGLGMSLPWSSNNLVSPANIDVLLRSRSIIYNVMMRNINVSGSDSMLLIELFLRTYPELVDEKDIPIFLAQRHLPFGEHTPRDSIFINICNMLASPNQNFFELKEAKETSSILLFTVNTEDEMLSYHISSILFKVLEEYYVSYKTERIRKQIAYVESELKKASSTYGVQLENTLSMSMPNINMGVYQSDPQLMKGKAELTLKRDSYQSLLSELERLKIQEKKQTPIFTIIDRAVLPLAAKRKSVITYGVLGAFIGMFVMAVLLLIVRYVKGAYYAEPNKC